MAKLGNKVGSPEGGAAKRGKKGEYFSTLRIVYIATFTAISFALRFWSFPILNAVPFLELDFSDVFVLIAGYSLGPVAGIITGVLKEVIYGICFTKTMFVGELANIIIMLPFVLIPSIMYKKHKGIKSVIFWIVVACVVRTLWSFPANLLLTFPAFTGFKWTEGMAFYMSVWYWVMLFNFIKCVILAAVVMVLYKSVSRLIGLINGKFEKNGQ